MTDVEPGTKRIVWVRGNVATERCPRSTITAQSAAWLELFALWQRLGDDLWRLPAKDADAMALLTDELERERNESQRRDR